MSEHEIEAKEDELIIKFKEPKIRVNGDELVIEFNNPKEFKKFMKKLIRELRKQELG